MTVLLPSIFCGVSGQVIAETFLTTFKPFFSRVVVISRSTSSSKALSLAALGAELIQTSFDEKELLEALKGVDIVVNALGSTELRTKDAIAEAVVGASVAIYFPSEFGMYVLSRANPLFPQLIIFQ